VSVPSYKRHRFPPEIIAHAVWLYYRFALSFRDIEEMLASRGVTVSYEAIRLWCGKFGPDYARRLRQNRRRVGRRWHVDEVFIRIRGTLHYLWRAVDQNGQVVDILVQARRDRTAAAFLSSSVEEDGYGASYRHYRSAPQLLCRTSSCPAQSETQTRALAEQPS
jgi:transposase-like protein